MEHMAQPVGSRRIDDEDPVDPIDVLYQVVRQQYGHFESSQNEQKDLNLHEFAVRLVVPYDVLSETYVKEQCLD